MSITLRVTYDDGDTVDVEVHRVDLLRLERCTGVPWHELVGLRFEGTPYKLAWLGLQRMGHESVQAFGDPSGLTGAVLDRAAEALALVGSVSSL